MQAPMPGTGDDRLARQLGAMQKKQQGDGDVGQPPEAHRDLTADGQHTGEQYDADQGQGEVVG
jgi:hypothetical protein